MSCHHDESSEVDKSVEENDDAVAYVSSVAQSDDACLCQYSRYIDVGVVRSPVKWDQYFERKLEVVTLPEIHYISRFHSDHQSQPDTPPPRV